MNREQRRKRKIWRQRLIILLIIFLWAGFHFTKNALQNRNLKQEIIKLERHLEVLELRGAELEREIEDWKSPENLERVAREELGLVKPGEILYILSESVGEDVDRKIEKRK